MNLRARKLGLIILSALTLFSCEEDISTIGLPPENNLGIFFADIPLGDHATQLWVDRVNSRGTGVILAGSYDDPDLGTIEARNFSEVILNTSVKYDTALANATFDSLVYSLRISGFSGINVEGVEQTLELYQLQEPINLIDEDSASVSFYTSSSQALASKVGESNFFLYPDSVGLSFANSEFKLLTEADTLFKNKFFDSDSIYIYRHNIKLNDAFGQGFFNQARSGVNFDDVDNFAEFFKGLAIVPSMNNSAIIEYAVANTRMTLYYTKNGVSRSIPFTISNTRSYNNISPNINSPWTTGDLTGTQPYVPFETSTEELFLQSGTNLLVKLDLSSLRQFEDTAGSAVIQSAKLRLGTRNIGSFLEPNSRVSMGLTSLDSLENENYYIDPLVNNQNTNVLTFDEEIPGYTVDIPLFAENLTSDNVEYDQVTLFLGNSNNSIAVPTSSEIKKVIVNKNDLKLRIYYTTPDKNNN